MTEISENIAIKSDNNIESNNYWDERNDLISETQDLKLQVFCDVNKFNTESKNTVANNPRLADFIQSTLQIQGNKDWICNIFDQCRISTHWEVS
jgi:hypothetical protein